MIEPNLDIVERNQKKYYNKIAKTYDSYHSNKYALKYRYGIYNKILKGIDFTNLKVLDAMCGGGANTGYFLNKGVAQITGADISEGQCKIYSERYPDNPVFCTSIVKTDFPDEGFDFVITDSLHHLYPNVDEGINEIYRILKRGGYFLIWEPSQGSFFNYFREKWYKMDRTYFEDNEQSIDINKLKSKHGKKFEFLKNMYGGNLAYLFVEQSMLFRIPSKLIKYYAPVLIPVDSFIQNFQSKTTACWVLSLLQKK